MTVYLILQLVVFTQVVLDEIPFGFPSEFEFWSQNGQPLAYQTRQTADILNRNIKAVSKLGY